MSNENESTGRSSERTVARRLIRVVLVALAIPVALVAILLGLLGSDAFLSRALPRLLAAAGYELRTSRIESGLGSRLSVRGACFGARGYTPLLCSKSIDLRYSVWGLLRGEGIGLDLGIQGPSVRLVLEKDGSINWLPSKPVTEEKPPPRTEAASSLIPALPIPIRLESLAVSDGEVVIEDRAGGTETVAKGIALEADGSASPARLEASLEIGELARGGHSLGPLDLRAGLEGNRITLRSLDLRVEDGSLGLTGTWNAVSGSVQARLRLDRLDPRALMAALGLTMDLPGPVTGEATIEGAIPESLRAHLDLAAPYREEELRAVVVAEGSLSGLREVDLDASWSGLAVKAGGSLDWKGDGTRIALRCSADSLAFVKRLADLPGLEGERLSLDVEVRGALAQPKVEVREVSLASVDFRGVRVEKPRVAGSFDGASRGIALTLGLEDLATREISLGRGKVEAKGSLDRIVFGLELGSSIRAAGDYDIQKKRVSVDAKVDDLPLDPFFRLAGLGDVRGTLGRVRARVAGPPSEIESLEGDLTLEGLTIQAGGERLSQKRPLVAKLARGRAEAAGEIALDRSSIKLEGSLALRERTIDGAARGSFDLADLARFARPFAPQLAQAAGTVEFRGKATGALDDPRLDVNASLRDLTVSVAPAKEGSAADSPRDPLLQARLDKLSLAAAGPLSRLSGHAELEGGQARAAGREVKELAARLHMDAGSYEVESLSVWANGARFAAHGKLGRDRRLEAEVRTVDAKLEQIPETSGAGLEGALELAVKAGGTLDKPRVEATVAAPGIRFQRATLGSFRVAARLADDRVTAEGDLPGGGTFGGSLGLARPRPFAFTLEIPDLLLDPYFDLAGDRLPAPIRDATGRLAARAHLQGELENPKGARGEIVLERLDLSAAKTTLKLEAPAKIALAGPRLDLDRLRMLVGQGFVEIAGSVTPERYRASLNASLDPSLAAPFVRGVVIGRGKVVTEASIEGSGRSITGRGKVEASLDSLEVGGLPDAIRRVELLARLDGSAITVENLRGEMGDGEFQVRLDGEIAGPSITKGTLSFVEIPYRIPGTLRVLTSGTLGIAGRPGDLLVSGRVRVDEALYERDVELLGGVLRPIARPGARSSSRSAPPAALEGIRLDVKIDSGETLRVRNNVARIVLSSDLTVGGNAARPRLLGQVRVAQGTVDLFGRTFQVDKGTIDFQNPLAIDPTILIQTSSQIQRPSGNVDVHLDLTGTVSQGLALKLTSDPSFPQDDIAFLLLTGKTRSEALAGGGKGGPSLSGLSVAALGLLGGAKLKEELGLSEFGLEQTETGNVQVTVGKKLSDRLSVRAVNQMGGAATSVGLSVEYKLMDQVLLVAEPQSTGSFNALVKLRFRFK